MKKILIISIFILILTLTTTIGYKVVSANTKINEVEDIIEYQQKKENYLTHYNYTLDNPNIVLNPYGNSPLTALIIFETEKEEEVKITIPGKDINSTYTNTYKKDKVHYIQVLGLYPNYENKIVINCGNIKKEIIIKTDALPEDLKPITKQNNTNQLYFITTSNYTYALDNNNDVRWYLTNKYTKEISSLKNGHLLLSNDTLDNNNNPTGLVEIDLLGKVYKEYNISEGYYGSYADTSNSILILSKNIIELDKQSGIILREIKLDNKYQTISYNENKNIIILENQNQKLEINYKTEKTRLTENNNIKNETEILLPIYNTNTYKITKGVKFTNTNQTKQSKENIMLLNYKKIDKNYKKHNIKINKESERLVIKANFTNQDKAYIILDKFMDKKIYDLKDGYNYINKNGLSGDYSIYIKINDTIYKTNNYVTF